MNTILWILGIWMALSVVVTAVLTWLLRAGKVRFVLAPSRIPVRRSKRSSGSARIP